MSPLLTQIHSRYPPLVDAPDALYLPLPGPREYTNNSACLASVGDLHRDRLMDANDKLFGIYQYCVHQNPGTHLDFGIEEGGKWQKRRKNVIFIPTQRYDVPFGQIRNSYVGIISVDLNGIFNFH